MKFNIESCSIELLKYLKVKLLNKHQSKHIVKKQIYSQLDKYYNNETEYKQTPNYQKALLKLQKSRNKTQISFNGMKLKYLPPIPEGIVKLSCERNKLFILPVLPNSLQELYCSFNRLTSLPNLPNNLEWLDCSYNQLTSLPTLPNNLQHLICSCNILTSLPHLPNSLQKLWCESNKLTILHVSDCNSLRVLTSFNNPLINEPELPINLSHYNYRVE